MVTPTAVRRREVSDDSLLRQKVSNAIPGERIKTTRLVRGGKYVVALELEMVIPLDDPSEPCYESEAVELMRQVAKHAEQGDTAWLEQHGQVYELIGSPREPLASGSPSS